MKFGNLPTGVVDWARAAREIQPGLTGTATIRLRQFGGIRMRLVEYSAGYLADHWCHEGHVLYVVSGRLTVEHRNEGTFVLEAGMSYHVATNAPSPHRVFCENGATIFVVD